MELTAESWILGQAFKFSEAPEGTETPLLLVKEFCGPKSLRFLLISVETGHITSF